MTFGDDVSVYVYPTELWNYIRQNRKLIEENEVVIAENPTNGVEIQVAIDDDPIVSVFRDGYLVHEVNICSLEDSVITLRALYGEYLTDKLPEEPDTTGEQEEAAEIDDEHLCMLRRIELEDAICGFLETVLCDNYSLATDEEIDSILEETLKLVASYGLPVYAPVLIGDELVEYPYDLETVE